MDAQTNSMDRDTAESYVDDIWEIQDDELEVMDCQVVSVGTGYALKVSCDTPQGAGVRMLKSIDTVERFLKPQEDWSNIRSSEVESWDADMGRVNSERNVTERREPLIGSLKWECYRRLRRFLLSD
jgi:hypothetical protein